MFAFSQIIAGGEKVSDVTKEMEASIEGQQKDSDENDAILAFSNMLPGNEGEPKKVNLDEATVLAEQKAKAELAKLSQDDATSALSVLAEAQEIQAKVEQQADDIEKEYKQSHEIKKKNPQPQTVKSQPKPKAALA